MRALQALPGADGSRCSTARPRSRTLAEEFKRAQNFLYLGRGYNFPTALEGALKLKEISTSTPRGIPAAEMKHGPIALIDEMMPVVFIAPHDSVFDKVASNVQEVKARSGRVIAITSRRRAGARRASIDYEIRIPETIDMLTPVLAAVPLAAAGVLHRGQARGQRRSAAQSGEVGHGRVSSRDPRQRAHYPSRVCGRVMDSPTRIYAWCHGTLQAITGSPVASPVRGGAAYFVCQSMRVLIQRVARAEVRVRDGRSSPGSQDESGEACCSWSAFVTVKQWPTTGSCTGWPRRWAACASLATRTTRMNLGLSDVGGSVLVVSQFTLYGDAVKGRRPSFIDAARPDEAEPVYSDFSRCSGARSAVEAGEFGAMMDVELVDDGPVTLWLEQ